MRKRDTKTKRVSPLQRIFNGKILLTGVLIVAGILIGTITGILIFWYKGLPDVSLLEKYEPDLTTHIYDCKGRVIATLFTENRIWTPLDKIPKNLIYAVLAAEDSDFYYHEGINFRGIIRALISNIKSGKIVEGGSTITQQLAKNLFLTPSKTLERKVKEMMLAFKIEQTYNKDKILELYLNEIYLGHGAYGVQAGAKTYFGKNVWELSLSECAFLAAVIKAPAYYSPEKNLNRALSRTRYVIKRMEELGFISHEEAEKALQEPLIFSNFQEERNWKAPYFVTFVLKYLLDKYGTQQVYRGGLKVYTTLDLDLQKYAEEALSKAPAEGAIIALEPQTGFIRAMVGGKDFKKSQFNRATQARRQVGSAFKAVLYTAAFESGLITESTLVEDSPIEFPNGWKPSNYDEKFHGWVTIREAFENSYNVVAVKVGQEVGPRKIIEYAKKMGIESPLPNDLSIALGSASVSPLEMARVYACIANGGFNIKPIAILEIRDKNGYLIEKNLPSLERVINEETAYIMIDMMRHVVKRGTGVKAMLDRPCAGKTGTTNDFIDAWFIGFTPDLLAAVYVGHDDCSPLGKGMTGGRVAAPIWKEFMEKALKNTPVRDFPIPQNITFVEVCAQSGKLPSKGCPSVVEEAFIRGTEPSDICDIHGSPAFTPRENIPKDTPSQTTPYIEPPTTKPKKEKEEDEIERKFQELLKKYGIKN